MKSQPSIKIINNVQTLFVNDKPFIALAGEIHNSSASTKVYMEEKVWPSLQGLNLNSLIVPIYWETTEPEEGRFEFDLLDDIIENARKNDLKLIFLWFGLWKNGLSTYIPNWMKKNKKDYFYVEKKNGERIYTISPLCEKAIEKDVKAFSKVIEHIKEIDEKEQTVIMVQIENEIGILGSDMDYSEIAMINFEKEIPKEVSSYAKKDGTWKDVFKEYAEEYFMVYYYAQAIKRLSQVGKGIYDIPYYINVWLEKFPWRAGNHPSGGPTIRMLNFWRYLTPDISAYAPDIYVPNFSDICDEYAQNNNPLIIPEARRDLITVSNLFYAIGKYHALCFSPFGIEDFKNNSEISENGNQNDILQSLSIDASAFNCSGTFNYLSRAYGLIKEMMPMIFKFQGTNLMHSFLKIKESDRGVNIPLSDFEAKITFLPNRENRPVSAGILIETGINEGYIIGTSLNIDFIPKRGDDSQIQIINLEEGEFKEGIWKIKRILNGDERYHLAIGEMPSILRFEIDRF